jgi:kanosamine-6-phosphate phosphatase
MTTGQVHWVEVVILLVVDFDETFMPKSTLNDRKAVDRLQVALCDSDRKFTLAIISGSNILNIESAIRDKRHPLPDYIASDLGTRLFQLIDGEYIEDQYWFELNRQAFINLPSAPDLTVLLQTKGLCIAPQPDRFQGLLKTSLYLSKTSEDDFLEIERTANLFGVLASVTLCSVDAGDPEGMYDVDFIPAGGGKGAVARYIRSKETRTEKLIAFGDSLNDESMFIESDRCYLVANSSHQAKHHFRNFKNIELLTLPYLAGVIEGLEREAIL